MNYSYNDTMTHAAKNFAGVSELGLQLVSTGCLAFVQGVFWQTPAVDAKTVREQFTDVCEASGKKAGSQKDYASLAMLFARYMVKTHGKGTGTVPSRENGSAITVGNSLLWEACQSAETVDDAVSHIVNYIKVDLECRTVRELRNIISKPAKPATKKGFADATYDSAVKKLESGEINAVDISDAVTRLMSILSVKPVESTQELRAAA